MTEMDLASTNVVFPPTPGITIACNRIDFGISLLINSKESAKIMKGQWEAPKHAWMLSILSLRHAGSVLSLARDDLVLLPSAWALARAALEATARIFWLLEGEDEWVREAKWILLVEEGARTFTGLATLEPEEAESNKAAATQINDFAKAVREKLPEGTQVPERMPKDTEMIASLGSHLSVFYKLASQHVHATDTALSTYKRDVEGGTEYGEFIEPRNWIHPLRVAWEACIGSISALNHLTSTSMPDSFDLVHSQIIDALKVVRGEEAMTTGH